MTAALIHIALLVIYLKTRKIAQKIHSIRIAVAICCTVNKRADGGVINVFSGLVRAPFGDPPNKRLFKPDFHIGFSGCLFNRLLGNLERQLIKLRFFLGKHIKRIILQGPKHFCARIIDDIFCVPLLVLPPYIPVIRIDSTCSIDLIFNGLIKHNHIVHIVRKRI